MKEQIPPFGLRMPNELKQWLKEKAENNRRSMNGELLKLLEDSKAREEGLQNAAQ